MSNQQDFITKKLAIFRNIKSDYETECEEWADENVDFVRLSEYTDVTFQLLSNEDVTNNELSDLDELERQLVTDYELKLNEIKTRRAELLSITYQPTE